MQIFVSGSLAYDRIMDFPGRFEDHILPEKIHILNVCFVVEGLKEKFGGTAGNIAYNLSLLGESPLILAAAGNDFDRYADWLKKHGLSLSGIRFIEDELTAGAYITTDMGGNQITGFNPGSMKYPSLQQFEGVNPQETLAIVAAGNVEDMVTYSKSYRELNIPYIFDPGQQISVLSGEQLTDTITGSELLISNDYELEMIMQATDLGKSDLLERTKAIISTFGDKGSLLRTQQGEVEIPAATALQVQDPTGAGDAYRAGLIKGLLMGKELADAARMGATCASYAVERYGTQEHSFTDEGFWARHLATFGEL